MKYRTTIAIVATAAVQITVSLKVTIKFECIMGSKSNRTHFINYFDALFYLFSIMELKTLRFSSRNKNIRL